jgi:hypothetical protein
VDEHFAEQLRGAAIAWVREGFDEQTAAPWIYAHIPPAAAAYLASHAISPEALSCRVPASAQGEMPLSVAIRSGLISAAQASRILRGGQPAEHRGLNAG